MGKLKDLFLFDKVKLRQLKTVSALVGLFAAIGRCCAWLVCVCACDEGLCSTVKRTTSFIWPDCVSISGYPPVQKWGQLLLGRESTRLPHLQCRFYPRDQVALLWRTPTLSRKPLRLYSRSPPFFKGFCWIFAAECPTVTTAAQITLITTCGSNSIAVMKFQLGRICCVLVHEFLPALRGSNI